MCVGKEQILMPELKLYDIVIEKVKGIKYRGYPLYYLADFLLMVFH